MKTYSYEEIELHVVKKSRARKHARYLEDVLDLVGDIRNLATETLIALYLNGKMDIIAKYVLAKGPRHGLDLDPVAMLQTALLTGARGIILVHNHPSGDPNPSSADIETTRLCFSAAGIFNITLMDHVIVTKKLYYSMGRHGHLKRFNTDLQNMDKLGCADHLNDLLSMHYQRTSL
ncbi:MAG TPA: JAB domain-containing protein [Bacteroidales bacterium]|nr:JAB domain-containing protein [Bacteroidales bacterium]